MRLEKIDDYRWLIPKTYKPGMRTDAMIYATERLLAAIRQDQSLEQAANVAMLQGMSGGSTMPDIHQGYGFPIGGVAAMDDHMAWSAGRRGFRHRLVCVAEHFAGSQRSGPKLRAVHQLFRDIPSGFSRPVTSSFEGSDPFSRKDRDGQSIMEWLGSRSRSD
jgi:tRNA-splicing ligase RtcB